ncbi:hypothetical protein FOYG_00674 [Fusarium oxysporum NRRL 32931]|uniref:Uncharacterized protein n=1 Tax=Fusarium oxysporum NRRL 32931 TaxID=660029 RepID=W9J807_FUSOX|nr:hypothetical protein FOYG_00674 [Fusarium oxysporum NRRL 32931]
MLKPNNAARNATPHAKATTSTKQPPRKRHPHHGSREAR